MHRFTAHREIFNGAAAPVYARSACCAVSIGSLCVREGVVSRASPMALRGERCSSGTAALRLRPQEKGPVRCPHPNKRAKNLPASLQFWGPRTSGCRRENNGVPLQRRKEEIKTLQSACPGCARPRAGRQSHVRGAGESDVAVPVPSGKGVQLLG